MKSDRKYVYILIAVLAIFTVYEIQKPKKVDWSQTFHFQDRIPFGTYVTHDLIKDMFEGGEADHVFDNFYGQDEAYSNSTNQLVLSMVGGYSELDYERLMANLDSGRTIMLGQSLFTQRLADTLELEINFESTFFTTDFDEVQDALVGQLKRDIILELPGEDEKVFRFPPVVVSSTFNGWNEDSWQALALDEDGNALLLKREFGRGTLYVCSMPLALTNYFVLDNETSDFAAALLSLFPADEPLAHNEYYKMGRIEPRSKLRFFLKNEALKWSVFILIVAILLFMIFEAKRRQRIIPVVKPLANTTLEFVGVLGRLYYRQSSHTKLARKRILYWKDFVRSHYNLKTDQLDGNFTAELIRKSGRDDANVKQLVMIANQVMENRLIAADELLLLEKLLNEFYDIK